MGNSFKDLRVWQRSIQLTVSVCKLTTGFPDAERFGLTNQLRRASVSIASNVAEGYGKSSRREYLQFLGHARGSRAEVETQLTIAGELGFGVAAVVNSTNALCSEVSKMLVAPMETAAHSRKEPGARS